MALYSATADATALVAATAKSLVVLQAGAADRLVSGIRVYANGTLYASDATDANVVVVSSLRSS